MKVLIVHGVSHKEVQPGWPQSDLDAIARAFQAIDPNAQPTFEFFLYDDLFARAKIDFVTYAQALKELVPNLLWHGVGDLFNRPRSMFDFVADRFRWTAGMVAQWSVDKNLRQALRANLAAHIDAFEPDVIVAHSMGSIICYDLFTESLIVDGSQYISGRTFVTLGCQIQNAALRKLFGGRLKHLDTAKHWFNLYNHRDKVLVTSITLQYPGFTQIPTPFEGDAPAHHAWEEYVLHRDAISSVWQPVVTPPAGARVLGKGLRVKTSEFNDAISKAVRPTTRRALLVGINEYPNPADRLEGCVNDVFQMSATLQECGFSPEEIRVVLDDRATANGIRERLDWLLEGIQDGDLRLLYYSGHGARIPTYGASGEVEGFVETLVPHDFDFSADRMVTDHDLLERYSNLPYDSYFAMILDCCHSGGLMRDGGPRIKGLSLPDDIRHRMLKWDIERRMWVARDFEPLLKGLGKEERTRFVGDSGASIRLGRATPLRSKTSREYDRIREEKGTKGPYMPTILTGCKEDQYSYEYRHGVTSYGAFTYAITETLRRVRDQRENPTFQDLMKRTVELLAELRFDQEPQIAGPTAVVSAQIPWVASIKP